MKEKKQSTFEQLRYFCGQIEEVTLVVVFMAFVFLTVLQVFLRYGFSGGLSWGEELKIILFSWFILLGIPYGFRKSIHLGVDVFARLLGRKGRFILNVIVISSISAYCIFLFMGGVTMLKAAYALGEYTNDLEWPEIYVRCVVLYCAFFSLTSVLFIGLDIIKGKVESFALGDEAIQAMEHYQTPSKHPQKEL